LQEASNISQDSQLVEQLKEGSSEAFEKLYAGYADVLYGYLVRLVKSESSATDILQETFVRVWVNKSNLNPELSFRSFLFKIATNLVYDFYRKAAHDKKLQRHIMDSMHIDYRHVEEVFQQKDDARILHQVINLLPPQRKQVFQLVKLEGMTYDEVSRAMNISTSTISDHIVKANKFIRGYLQRSGTISIPLFFLLFE
jgi:RNA polymerase sigma-70 factor (ECF subfamily)